MAILAAGYPRCYTLAARWRAQIDDCARGAHLLLWAVIMNILVVCRECGAGECRGECGSGFSRVSRLMLSFIDSDGDTFT